MNKIKQTLAKLLVWINPYKAFFIFTIILAAILRLYRLQDNPVALNQDEAINGYDALSLGITLRDHHNNFLPPMLESFGDWSSPLITYLTIPFVKIFGLSEFSIRFPVALLGVGSTILIYYLIKRLFNRRDLALLGSFILAISPWDITLSRWAIPPSIVVFFLMLFLLTFLWAYQKGKKTPYLQAILVGLTAGIAVYSYPTQKLFLPLFVGSIFIIFIKGNFKKLVVSGAVFSIIIAPIFYLTLTQPEKYNSRYDSVSLSQSGENYKIGFIERYFEYLTPNFLFGRGDYDTQHQVPGFGNFDWGFAMFFYLGLATLIYVLVKKKDFLKIERKHLFILLSWLILFPLAASITKEHFMLLRVVHAFPLFIMFIVLGYAVVIERYPKYHRLLFTTLVLLGILSTTGYYYNYFTKYRETSKKSYNYGIKGFMDYLKQNDSKFDKVVIDNEVLSIYYLFYSSYNPKDLLQLVSTQSDQNRYKDFGKYQFKVITDDQINSAKEIYSVQDQDNTWYKIYETTDRNYLVKKL